MARYSNGQVPVSPAGLPSYTTRVILVRHGRSEFNVEGRVQGGGRLDPIGRAQVTALAARLQHEPLGVIYASPTVRTLQTARPIARRHGLPIRRSRLLSDINFGIFSNMAATEARARDPGLWQQWWASPHAVRFPGGESLGDLRQRMLRFFDEARTWGGHTVLAVTHDSPIRVAACIALGLDDADHQKWVADTASVTIVELSPGRARLVQPYADVQHLRDIDAA